MSYFFALQLEGVFDIPDLHIQLGISLKLLELCTRETREIQLHILFIHYFLQLGNHS